MTPPPSLLRVVKVLSKSDAFIFLVILFIYLTGRGGGVDAKPTCQVNKRTAVRLLRTASSVVRR